MSTIKNGTKKGRDSHGRFAPGWSGGPGRPKNEDSLTQALRDIADPKKLAQTLYTMAVDDKNLNALMYVYNRLEGTPKVTQRIENVSPLDAEWLSLAQGFVYSGNDDPDTTDDPEPVPCVRPVLAPAEQRYDEDGLDDRDY